MGATIEILIFAVIAAVLVGKLRSVLGEKYDGEPQYKTGLPQQSANTNDSADTHSIDDNEVDEQILRSIPRSIRETLQQMQAIDSSVSVTRFLQGARKAFRMIVEAYAKGDRETLETLLSEKLYKAFDKDITRREKDGHKMHVYLKRILGTEITDAYTRGGVAHITLKIGSDELRYTEDKDGNPIEGDKHSIETVHNLWTFTRKLNSDTTMWQLETTAAA